MELRERKIINNTKLLPGYDDGTPGWLPNTPENRIKAIRDLGIAPKLDRTLSMHNDYIPHEKKIQPDQSGASAGPWFAIGSWLGGGVVRGLLHDTAKDYLALTTNSLALVGGVSYNQLNGRNTSDIMNNYDKDTALSFLTNPAEGITRIFSRSAAKKEAEKYERIKNWANMDARDIALSDSMYKDQSGLYVWLARDGKPIFSAIGQINAKATGKVSNGETIVSPEGYNYTVPGKPNFADGKLAYLRPQDAVLSNHGASQYYLKTGDLNGALAMDEQHRMNKYGHFKNGKIPGFKEGWFGNFAPSMLGGLASIGQMILAGRLTPYRPNISRNNRYMTGALNTLKGLRINPYSILPNIYNLYGKTMAAINSSGGLSAGLKAASRISAMNQTLNTAANLGIQSQAQNNTYLSNWAQQSISAGAHQAQLDSAADQYSNDYYAKSHAARQQGLQMGLYDLINNVQSYIANDFKRRQFNSMYGLYAADRALDRDKYNYYLNTGRYPG